MELSTILILILLVIVIAFLVGKKKKKIESFIRVSPSREKKKIKTLPANHPLSPLYNWHLLDDLDNENLHAPWDEIFTSTIVDLKDLHGYQKQEAFRIWHEECKVSIADMDEQKCFEEDIVIVHWSSSPESWDHLAGRAGYIFISKKEKRQIDFLMTMIS